MASVVVVAVALLVRDDTAEGTVLVMDGHSMDSTFTDGDELLVDPGATFERGDIVVVNETSAAAERILIKRVIALPGVTIEMRNYVVTIDGDVVEEQYLDAGIVTPGNCGGDYGPATVPDNHVFVMGDNRSGSQDSRSENVGPIDESDVTGVVESVPIAGRRLAASQ